MLPVCINQLCEFPYERDLFGLANTLCMTTHDRVRSAHPHSISVKLLLPPFQGSVPSGAGYLTNEVQGILPMIAFQPVSSNLFLISQVAVITAMYLVHQRKWELMQPFVEEGGLR